MSIRSQPLRRQVPALDLVLDRARFDGALDRIAERGGFQSYTDTADVAP